MTSTVADAQGNRLAEKLPWFALGAAALAADLWTKHVVFYPHALDPFPEGRVVGRVTSWWRTVIAYNEGATFGLGAKLGPWVLTVGVSVVIALLVRSLWRSPRGERAKCFAFSIIVGGAIGNLYDRALRPFIEPDKHPGVRDFIDWYFPDGSAGAEFLKSNNVTKNWYTHWYTFNVADALIVSGVVLLAWKILREKPPEAATAKGGA